MVQIMEDENAAFWLPTHFLTDDDFFSVADDNNTKLPTVNNKNNNSGFGFGFGSDPFDSPVSTPDNDENDDALLISHLTRHLAQTSIYDKNTNTNNTTTSEKPWLFSTSPQSTLSGFGAGWSNNNRSGFSSNGSPNGPSRVPSPPLTPELKNDAAWELLYEAAGQVARLKMNAIAAQLNNNNNNNNRGLLGAPRHATNKPSHHHHLYNNQYQELKWAQERENGSNYCPHHHHHHNNNHQQGRSCGGAPGLSQTAWPPLMARQPHHHYRNHNNHHNYNCGSQMRSMYQGGSGGVGVKRQSAGTGVFLPRRVSTSPPRHHPNHKKPTVLPSSRAVQEMEATNNLDSHSRFGGVGFPTDFEMRMARRNAAVVGQQRRNTAMVGPGHEIRLPNDWTY